jgi:hypothetical protein
MTGRKLADEIAAFLGQDDMSRLTALARRTRSVPASELKSSAVIAASSP